MQQLGFQSAQAVPMRLRADTIGALNIFRSTPGPLPGSDLRLAERAGLEMDQAFTLMRDYARSHNRRLSDVAAAIIDGSVEDVLSPNRPGPHR
jgi:hypothetical protein